MKNLMIFMGVVLMFLNVTLAAYLAVGFWVLGEWYLFAVVFIALIIALWGIAQAVFNLSLKKYDEG